MDTFISKINGAYFYPILKAEGEEQDRLAKGVVETVEKEIEPLLKGAAPFFGGSESITLAEVCLAPFIFSLLGVAALHFFVPFCASFHMTADINTTP